MSFRVLYSCFRADLEVTDRHSVQFRGPAGKVLLTIRGRVQVYEGPTRGFSYGRVAGRVRARVWHDCRQAQGSYGISGRVEVRSLSEVPMESKFSGLFGGPATVSPCREVGMQAIGRCVLGILAMHLSRHTRFQAQKVGKSQTPRLISEEPEPGRHGTSQNPEGPMNHESLAP